MRGGPRPGGGLVEAPEVDSGPEGGTGTLHFVRRGKREGVVSRQLNTRGTVVVGPEWA